MLSRQEGRSKGRNLSINPVPNKGEMRATESRRCPPPRVTASAPGHLGTRRDATDITDEHSRRKWLNSHALHYQRLVTWSDNRAIYTHHRVQLTSTHAFSTSRRRAARPPTNRFFIPGPLLLDQHENVNANVIAKWKWQRAETQANPVEM
jgi:hypothetical protein